LEQPFTAIGSQDARVPEKDRQASLRRRRSKESEDRDEDPVCGVRRKSRSITSRTSGRSKDTEEEHPRKPKPKNQSLFSGCLACVKGLTGKSQRAGAVFADDAAAKAEMKEGMGKREYDVADFYRKEGCAQAIARNTKFASLTLVVISINSLWIGVEMDLNEKDNLFDAEWYFQAGEFFFCFFFLFEWLCRCFAFRRKCDGLRDKWFCFDAFLVSLMLFETIVIPIVLSSSKKSSSDAEGEEEGGSGVGNLTVLRMLRLLRLTRMVRFMRAMPELVTLIKSMNIAARPVLSTLGLLFIIIYIFAIIFKSQLNPKDVQMKHKFGKLGHAMFTLLMDGTFLDSVDKVSNGLLIESPLLTVVFILFILLSSFTVLNLLIGMLCEVVNIVSKIEKERAMVTWVKSKLMDVLEMLDEDGSGMISKDEFDKLLQVPMAVNAMEELGVDVQNLVALSDHLFQSETSQKDSQRVSRVSRSHEVSEHQNGLDHFDLTVEATVPDPNWAAKSKALGGSSFNRTQSFIQQAEESSSEEEEERELSFGDFIETVIRLRSENHPSMMEITQFRKLCVSDQDKTLARLEDIQAEGDKLNLQLQEEVCNHPFYKLLCDHPELRKSTTHGSHHSHHHDRRISQHHTLMADRSRDAEAAEALRKKLLVAAERRLAEACLGSPDEIALERAFTMADAVEVMAEDMADVLDLEMTEEALDKLEVNDSPERPPQSARSRCASPRPDTFALAKALTTAATSLVEASPMGSSASTSSRLPLVPRGEPLDLTPTHPNDRGSPTRQPVHEEIPWLFPDSPLQPPSEAQPSRGGSPISTRATSRDRGSSPEAARDVSREDSLSGNAAALRRALACCSEEGLPSNALHDVLDIRPLRPPLEEDILRSPESDTSSLVTLHAVLPGPDEDALQRAFLFADNSPSDESSFLDDLCVSLEEHPDG